MESKYLRIPGAIVYPGLYVPILSEQDMLEEIKKSNQPVTAFPPVNIIELGESIRVEMAIPGVKREDFLVHVDEHMLSICVFHKEPSFIEEKDFSQHEFNYTCIDRQIPLPENADSSFISAEYRDGILCIIIPTSSKPVKELHAEIVVY